MQDIQSYKDLIVWRKSMELVEIIYKTTEAFLKSELYGLTSQMKRAAISIPSNIAEGRRRGTRKDYRNFLITAFGSGAELETQLIIAHRLSYINQDDHRNIDNLLNEVMRMLNKMISSLQATT